MIPEYWQKQTVSSPLFPELAWSRPENRNQAGKLLIVGGNKFGFAAPATAYAESDKAGVGTRRVLLPDALKKTVGALIEDGEYTVSTPSGSFSQEALADWLSWAHWSDGVLLAGDFGRNAETAVLIEKFLAKSPVLTVITQDAIDYIAVSPQTVLGRQNTILVLSFSQLQKLSIASKFEHPLTFDMGLLKLVEWLHEFSSRNSVTIVLKYLKDIVVANEGMVSTTKLSEDLEIWRVKTSAHVATWSIQNSTKLYEAISVAVNI